MSIPKREIFWEPIIAACILLMTILGVMVPLYMHSDNATRNQIEAIRQDIKDFHEKIIRIEERNNK